MPSVQASFAGEVQASYTGGQNIFYSAPVYREQQIIGVIIGVRPKEVMQNRFHMVKLFNDSVLTAIRRRLQNECDENKDREGFKLLKGSRYILLTSPEKLREKEEEEVENNERLRRDYISKGLSVPPGERLMRTGFVRKLETLLFANGELNVAYLLLDQFKSTRSQVARSRESTQ